MLCREWPAAARLTVPATPSGRLETNTAARKATPMEPPMARPMPNTSDSGMASKQRAQEDRPARALVLLAGYGLAVQAAPAVYQPVAAKEHQRPRRERDAAASQPSMTDSGTNS